MMKNLSDFWLDFKAWTSIWWTIHFIYFFSLEHSRFSLKSSNNCPQNKPQSLFIKMGSGYENRKINPPKAGLRSHNGPQNGYVGRKMIAEIGVQSWAVLVHSASSLRSQKHFRDRRIIVRSQNYRRTSFFPAFGDLVITSYRNVQIMNGLKR